MVYLLTLFYFFTPSSPSPTSDGGDYELVMFKNGVRVTKYCGWRGKCMFKVRYFFWFETPVKINQNTFQ